MSTDGEDRQTSTSRLQQRSDSNVMAFLAVEDYLILEDGDGGFMQHSENASSYADSWLDVDDEENRELTNEVQRVDTLERNPIFVNPHDVHQQQQKMDLPTAEDVAAPSPEMQNNMAHGKVELMSNQTLDISSHEEINNCRHEFARRCLRSLSPTGARPSLEQWEGNFKFKVEFKQLTNGIKNKHWDLSFSAGEDPMEGLYIRALPVFSLDGFFTDPVKRCPNHASKSEASNEGFPMEFVKHLIRVNHVAANYEEDPISKRLSVTVPFERPQVGTNCCNHLFKFMCLGSDVGGINRKPVKVIFTLEKNIGEVLGRYTVDVRICSCPKRDKLQEEAKHQKASRTDGLARSNSTFSKPSAKRWKSEAEEFVMVPVAKVDFEKINEFAEAAVIMRNPRGTRLIKDERRKLLELHNKKYLNASSSK